MFGLKKRTWIIGGVVAALLGTSAVAARWHDHTPAERVAFATERVADKMELNDSQKAAFEKVATSMMEVRGTRTEFMVDLAGKLKELANDDTLTVEEVNTLRDQIKAQFDKAANAVIPDMVTFYNSLDDKQREMVTARLERMSERMDKGEYRGNGHHGKDRKGWGHGWGHGWGKQDGSSTE